MSESVAELSALHLGWSSFIVAPWMENAVDDELRANISKRRPPLGETPPFSRLRLFVYLLVFWFFINSIREKVYLLRLVVL